MIGARLDLQNATLRTDPQSAALPIDSRTRAVARTVIAILLVILALWIARDFLSALTWAMVMAITAWPIYVRFARLIGGGRSSVLAPLLFTFLTGFVLIVPVILTVHQIGQRRVCAVD
jgi:predicted PurR-regulated permease PerM